jgi:hypothetical protein
MKATHAMANHFFSELSITEKRWILCIIMEKKSAEEKHKTWPKDIIHAASIVVEEAGELIKAALQHRYEKKNLYSIHGEAIQTGAMALRMLCNLPVAKFSDEGPETEPKYENKKQC